jgi:hypothetical protein
MHWHHPGVSCHRPPMLNIRVSQLQRSRQVGALQVVLSSASLRWAGRSTTSTLDIRFF